ncbi:platelet-activating factor receptor-like [Aplysia californica]|uniref:Platelet-activating factor receptor-like n=1 Tax=Aplysia californica TaxID=6500 RepID=A0ABM0JGY6_APLCA|nr:platelet-activating factor receptor-like [Aplysia californica]
MNNSSNTTSLLQEAQASGLLNERVCSILLFLNWSVLCAIIAVFGIVANIINIIVFIKMGVRGTAVNLSLLCLSVADLGSLLLLAWISLASNPLFTSLDLPFIPLNVAYVTGGWPRLCFVRTSGGITAFVTLERCLCIKTPLRVHRIFTPKRTAICLAAIFFLMLLSALPAFAYIDLAPIFDPEKNKTLIGTVYNDKENTIKPVVTVAGFVVTTGSFLCVSVFSAVLIHALIQRRQKWECSKNVYTLQTGAARSSRSMPTQNKDMQVAKMILLIAAVFITCFVPHGAIFLIMELVEEFNTGKAYHNLFTVCISFIHIFEGVSFAINILLYIKLSSKFRHTIRALFLPLKQTSPV